MKTKDHYLFIDGLRAIAAIYVVMHHAVLQIFTSAQSLTGVRKLLLTPFFFGHYAVDFFIVLSGFCLMIPTIKNNYQLKGGFIEFIKHRVIRILPPYYLALIFSLLLIQTCIGNLSGSHWDISLPVTQKDVITHLFLIHDLFVSSANKINHSLWSVSVECRIYVLFPLLLYVWQYYRPGMALVLAAVLSIIIFVALSYYSSIYKDINIALVGVSPYLILFTLGMLTAHLSFKPQESNPVKNSMLWVLVGIAFLILSFMLRRKLEQTGPVGTYLEDIMVGVFSACLLMVCTSRRVPLLNKFLSLKPLVFVGAFSYSLYLLHAPLLQVIHQYMILPLGLSDYNSVMLLIVYGTLLSIILSYGFYLLCERPFHKMVKKDKVKAKPELHLVN